MNVTLAAVLASTPDSIEEVYQDMLGTTAGWTEDRVTLTISREPIVDFPCPAHRITQSRFPGVFR